tara:strand:- start:3095 stop:3865 length:771 start_codon:yes stop_codon:yes gene_type:complete
MKKHTFTLLTLALILVGCQKGSVKGQVLDVFTKKPIAKAKVQIINTPFTTTVGNDGAFEFKELDLGKVLIKAGKNKFSQSEHEIVLTEKAPDNSLNIYLFNRKRFAPGLYLASENGPQKILNKWVGMDAICTGDVVAFNQKMVNKKTKAKIKLESAYVTDAKFEGYYFQKGGNEAAIEVVISPISVRKANKYKDACKSITKNRKLVVADLSKGKTFQALEISNQMVKFEVDLKNERQLVSIKQKGKILANYILKAK